MKGGQYRKTLAKIWFEGIIRTRDIRGNLLPKFIELCMETPCWSSSGWAPTWRTETNRNITEFCYKSVNLLLEELINLKVICFLILIQSFPRKSSNTASPMMAHNARDFTWNRGCRSNSPPLTHRDQIPHPLDDSDNQVPSSPGRQRCQMPGVCPGVGGCWSFDLTDTFFKHWYSVRLLSQILQTCINYARLR